MSIFTAICGAVILLTDSGWFTSILGIVISGFAVAPIFPGLMSDTHNRVGRLHQTNAIGMQVAAAGFGSAIVPWVAGAFARVYGLNVIPLYILCVLILLFVSFLLSQLISKKFVKEQHPKK